MSQIFEALRKAEALEADRKQRQENAGRTSAERRRSKRRSITARIRVYGHGPGLTPFFEENSILNVSEAGALLVLKTPVAAGQKLLLINEAAEQVQECRVVRTSCRDTKELQVAVEFPIPRPQFWNRLGDAAQQGRIEKRSLPRIALPQGMSITWKGGGESVVSRVQTISAAGLSITTPQPPPVGEVIEVHFDVPAGEVSAQAIVRHSQQGRGMGVEFVGISPKYRARLTHLMQKLLP